MKVSLNPRLHAHVSAARINNSTVSVMSKPDLRSSDKISFGNSAPVYNQIFVGAELEGFVKAGGVATVMGDYLALGQPMVIPYYNGSIKYDPKTGLPTGEVGPLMHNGTPIFTTSDLDAESVEQIVKNPKNFVELEEIDSKKMAWGKEKETPIKLYRVKNNEKFKNLYLVYTDATAKMKKPYDGSSGYYSSEGGIPITKNWDGDPYAKFDKAFVEFMDKYGVKEGTVVCSDAQTAYIPHYMAEKTLKNDPAIEKLRPSYIAHNLGDGYQGATSARNMVVNLGITKEQIEMLESDEEFIKALKEGTEEEYLKKLVPQTLDNREQPNPIKLIMEQRKQGYIAGFDTVSEEYAQAIANNPRMAKAIQAEYQELLKDGKAGGILNALNDPRLGYDKPVTLPGYNTPIELKDASGNVIETIEPFKQFPTDATVEDVRKIKLENKKNLFNRLSGKYTDNMVLTGVSNKKAELIGTIDQKWISKINAGEQVDLFVSWGRGDLQKALDTVIDAFEIYAKTPEGANAVLVLGGELPEESAETERILSRMKVMLADERFKGRISFMNGFAPGVPLASAGDMALFPSRFAPCELTDLEAIKYLCTPNVSNTQGLKQKNFDPRDAKNADIATSYRTKTEFFCSIEEAKQADPKLSKLYDELLLKEKTKLKLRGIEADKIEKLAQENVLESKKFSNALRESVDARIAQELADNMVEFKRRPQDLVARMLENQKNIKTKWWENALLHPDKKSTGELYKIKHFESKSTKPTKSIFNFSDEFAKIRSKLQRNSGTQETLSSEEIIGQFKKSKEFKNLLKKHYGIAAGAVVAAFAAGALIFKNRQKQNKYLKPSVQNAQITTNNNQHAQNPNFQKVSMPSNTVNFPAFFKK